MVVCVTSRAITHLFISHATKGGSTIKLLQENAGRGEILVSEATYQLVEEDFDFEAITPTKTRAGLDMRVVYRLVGRKRRTGSARAVRVE